VILRRGFLIAFVLAATLGFAQEDTVRVSRSSGTAEIEIPGRGWLQAVSGRALPEGGSVATWTGASLDVAGLGVEIELGPLTLLELVSVEVNEGAGRSILTVRLGAGTVGARTGEARVVVLTEHAELTLEENGALSYGDDVVDLATGAMTVRYRRGGDREVTSPATVDLRELSVKPILETP